jgi:hypothetical protein
MGIPAQEILMKRLASWLSVSACVVAALCVCSCNDGNRAGYGYGGGMGPGTGGGCGPGNGTGDGMGCGGGMGVYLGTWTGSSTNTACVDTGELAASNFCAQLRAGMVPLTLTLLNGSGGAVTGSLAITGGNTRFSGQVSPSIGASGDLALTGSLSTASSGPFTSTLTAWDSVAKGNTMTGTWSMTVTSSQSDGSANTQWSLAGVTQTKSGSASPMAFGANPVGP